MSPRISIVGSSEGSLLADDDFLRDVASRYYELDQTQSAIAKAKSCSRQLVGKALEKARDKGIVRITIVPDERSGYIQNLTRDLRLALRLDDLVLVPGGHLKAMEDGKIVEGLLADIATTASNYIDQFLQDGMTLAVSGGKRIMRNVVRYLKPTKRLPNLKVISTMGFTEAHTNFGDPNLIAHDIAMAYGGLHYWLPIPAIVGTQEQCQQARSLPIARTVLRMGENADVVVLGLWPAHKDGTVLVKKGLFTEEQVERLRPYQPVADIDHWAFNIDGECINKIVASPTPFYLTGLEIPKLKERIKRDRTKVILVAGASTSYAPAILSVLRAGVANILITDHLTAELLVELLKKS